MWVSKKVNGATCLEKTEQYLTPPCTQSWWACWNSVEAVMLLQHGKQRTSDFLSPLCSSMRACMGHSYTFLWLKPQLIVHEQFGLQICLLSLSTEVAQSTDLMYRICYFCEDLNFLTQSLWGLLIQCLWMRISLAGCLKPLFGSEGNVSFVMKGYADPHLDESRFYSKEGIWVLKKIPSY